MMTILDRLPPVAANVPNVIIEHVRLYRMSVLEAVHKVPQLRGRRKKEIKRVLRELCRQGQLAMAPLYGNRRYYFFPLAGDSHSAGGPLSELAKIRAYAMLAFCCLGSQSRRRLAPRELEQNLPSLYRPGIALNYYVTDSDASTLGFLRIDSGGRGRWDRVVAKCRGDLARHEMDPYVRRLMESGRFEITLITAMPQKAARIQRAILGAGDRYCNQLRICVMPELLNLIAPPPK